MPFIAYRYCWFFAGMVPLPNGKAGGNSGYATTKGCELYRRHLIMWSAITSSCKWEPLYSAGFRGGATTAFESSSGALMAETVCVKFIPVTGTEVPFHQCCGSVTFSYGSGSANPCLWPMDPDPAIFVLDLQDANKKLFLYSEFFANYFWRYIYIIFLR